MSRPPSPVSKEKKPTSVSRGFEFSSTATDAAKVWNYKGKGASSAPREAAVAGRIVPNGYHASVTGIQDLRRVVDQQRDRQADDVPVIALDSAHQRGSFPLDRIRPRALSPLSTRKVPIENPIAQFP